MWNKDKSLYLSRILTYVCAGLAALFTLFVPGIAQWYNDISDPIGILAHKDVTLPMIIVVYFCAVMAFWVLWSLHKLLSNISNDKVFIPENTACLRAISWACMIVGAALLVLAIWRAIFVFFAFIFVFLGLVMRVMKNVFENAVEIKSENDFTI
ncbi:MAG: DUF2975 domain-containing protein [Ruminococcus sp.]|nr:DUF2975 domain-containing protein [Ruminococcus sp.]